ncbi:hypothetical protein C162_26817 [Paenibacillus sp. FSL R7-269]|nr:hypothetical protein C162_26817 [Paenibacillus sp. FSL R7-269]
MLQEGGELGNIGPLFAAGINVLEQGRPRLLLRWIPLTDADAANAGAFSPSRNAGELETNRYVHAFRLIITKPNMISVS